MSAINHYFIFAHSSVCFLKNGFLEIKHIIFLKKMLQHVKKKRKRKLTRKMRMKQKKGKKKRARKLNPKLLLKQKLVKLSVKKKFRNFWKLKKIWFALHPNTVISKKSTNSRMGKGKGSLKRWKIKVKSKTNFIKFMNFNTKIIKRVFYKWQGRLPLPIKVTANCFVQPLF